MNVCNMKRERKHAKHTHTHTFNYKYAKWRERESMQNSHTRTHTCTHARTHARTHTFNYNIQQHNYYAKWRERERWRKHAKHTCTHACVHARMRADIWGLWRCDWLLQTLCGKTKTKQTQRGNVIMQALRLNCYMWLLLGYQTMWALRRVHCWSPCPWVSMPVTVATLAWETRCSSVGQAGVFFSFRIKTGFYYLLLLVHASVPQTFHIFPSCSSISVTDTCWCECVCVCVL